MRKAQTPSSTEEKIQRISALDLLHELAENKSQLRGPLLGGIFSYLHSISDKNAGKPYPIEKFNAFLWLANFAHVIRTPSQRTLTINLSVNANLDNMTSNHQPALYYPNEHAVRIRLTPKQAPTETKAIITASGVELKTQDKPFQHGLDFRYMSGTLTHELTHAMANLLYNNDCTPPESTWGSTDALAMRMSMLAPYVSNSQEESFSYFRYSYYQLEQYAKEFIAEVISYCIEFGELPFQDYLQKHEILQLKTAIDSFLQDCSDFLQQYIKESGITDIFPWLRDWDPISNHLSVPDKDAAYFSLFMRSASSPKPQCSADSPPSAPPYCSDDESSDTSTEQPSAPPYSSDDEATESELPPAYNPSYSTAQPRHSVRFSFAAPAADQPAVVTSSLPSPLSRTRS